MSCPQPLSSSGPPLPKHWLLLNIHVATFTYVYIYRFAYYMKTPFLKLDPQVFIVGSFQLQQVIRLMSHRLDPSLKCLRWPQVGSKPICPPSQPDKGQLPKAGVLGPSLISSITRHEKGTAVVTSKFCPFDHTKQDYGESWNRHKAEWREGIQLESCRHDAKNNLFMTAVHSHVSVAWIVSNANLKISHPARAAHLF